MYMRRDTHLYSVFRSSQYRIVFRSLFIAHLPLFPFENHVFYSALTNQERSTYGKEKSLMTAIIGSKLGSDIFALGVSIIKLFFP